MKSWEAKTERLLQELPPPGQSPRAATRTEGAERLRREAHERVHRLHLAALQKRFLEG